MKVRMRLGLLLMLCCVAGLALALPVWRADAQRGEAARNITGTVVGVGGRFGGRSYPFRLIIERYTSDEEVRRLNAAMESGGQDGLLRAIRDMRAGRIQVGTGVGLEANVILPLPKEGGGSKLVVLFERNINFYEVRRGTRSQDYRFGYAELHMEPRGAGEGTFIPAAKVRLRDGNTWEVEDFGVFPARLMGLQQRGGGRGPR
ncbi:MAG TPA: hypothetical protein VFX96_17690 [Pyrinomonadaceae bacterium]|nr:hypothetical protein [Pyrinomonadaceae bacterium]